MMASLCSQAFQVNCLEPRLIQPAKPTPHETKLLSDIDDQLGLRFHVPFIMSYKNNPSVSKQNDPVEVISDALSKALEYYYPFAGRLRDGPKKKLMVDCTGEGILLVEANANVTLDQLRDAILPPCPILEEFLFNVPGSDGILGSALLLIQVTRLTCGGFIFALLLNHTMCDAFGLVQFLNAVGEIARGADVPSTPPVWERELLNSRDPPRITCTHHEFDATIDHSHPAAAATVQRSFCFGPKEIMAIRKHLPPHLSTCTSTFELITACVWKCRTISLELNPKQIVRLSCTVGARGKHNSVCLPPGYYGNTFAYPAVVSTAELLCNSSLEYAVELVRKSKAKMNEEYFKSVADFMEIKGRPPLAMGDISDFIVSDNTRTGLGEIDFGWGKPVYAGVAKSTDLISFYVRDNNQEEQYRILVPICLPLSSLERFQQELKRMTTLEYQVEISANV